MNIKADSILNEEEKEFLAKLAVNELESEGVVIESYDPESDNPFGEYSYQDEGYSNLDIDASNRLMSEYRKTMEIQELLDNPFE